MLGIVIESRVFKMSITISIILNTILLSTIHYGMSSEFEETISTLNFIFTIIFAIEMLIKLIAFGIKGYFSDGMNYLDFIVVIYSFIDLIFLTNID